MQDPKLLTDTTTREQNSVDASIFHIVPRGIFVPETRRDVLDFVRRVIGEKKRDPNSTISLTSRAAGTCMSGGSLTDEYMISFTENLNKIIEINKVDKTVAVEPGCFYRDLEKETLRYNLIYPSYPASRELCAVGGIVGNNAAGEKTFKYGKTEDYIKEIEMICADGNSYEFKEFAGIELDNILQNDRTFFGDLHRKILQLVKDNEKIIEQNKPTVTKNSSGYYLWKVYDKERHSMNLSKLICGSQGTLGVMTEVKLKLVSTTPHSQMAVVFLKNIQDMPLIVDALAPYKPESFEVFDDHTFKIAMKFLPDLVKRLGGSLFSLGLLFWPEAKMVLTGSIPKIVMLIEFAEESSEILDKKISKVQTIFDYIQNHRILKNRIKTHIVKSEKEAKKYWIFRRESFNLLRSKLPDVRTVPFIEDVVVPANKLSDFLPRFEKILDEEKLVYTIAGHVGDGNIHVIPLMKLREEKKVDHVKSISDKVYKLVQEFHGSLSGEHNDGLVRAPFLHYMFSAEMLNLFKEVKNIFDPLNIFNPNKKIGIDWQYAQSKIDRRK
jgi:FAD/FMN-containing dehydrogenase